MKTFGNILLGILVFVVIPFGCWVSAGYLSSRFLPESLWIPVTVLGLVGGIGISFGLLRVFSK